MITNSKEAKCNDKRKCCFRDAFGRCTILRTAQKNCGFAKPDVKARPYRLKK